MNLSISDSSGPIKPALYSLKKLRIVPKIDNPIRIKRFHFTPNSDKKASKGLTSDEKPQFIIQDTKPNF